MSSRFPLALLSLPLLFVGCFVQPADPDEELVDDAVLPLSVSGTPAGTVESSDLNKTTQSESLDLSSNTISGDKPQPDPWAPPDPWETTQQPAAGQTGSSSSSSGAQP